MQTRHWVGLVLAALLVRAAFVAWAPHVPWADGRFYHLYATAIHNGYGYVNVDGSPAIRWMPGWPFLLSGLYRVFGADASVGMWANVVFDSLSVGVIGSLATRLFDARCGLIAAALWALWPGLIYYSATLYSESIFHLLFSATLWLLVTAAGAERQRALRFAAVGVGFGLCSLIKAEPLALLPVALAFAWMKRRSTREWAVHAGIVAVAIALTLTPWTLRNERLFDRFIPLSASGGISAHLTFYPGATGGQNHMANAALNRFYRGADSAQTSLARMDAGWNDAWRFIRADPADAARIVLNKFAITYGGDAQGARTMRGPGAETQWNISAASWRTLQWLADGYWFAMLALAAVGASRLRGRPLSNAVLVLGLPATWWGLHVLFLGGQRYHVPEAIAYAMLAALSVDALLRVREARGAARS
jgi:hypothetical protein